MKSLRQRLLILASLILFFLPLFYWLWQSNQGWLSLVAEKATRPIRQELKLHAEPLPWLKTEGRYIVDDQGNRQVLRGVNVASINWGREDWNDKAVEYAINHWGAQVIRTRVFQDEFEEDQTAFFAKMEQQIIRPARKLGVYVILHPWIHENQPLPDQGTIIMWQAIAQRYRDDPTVLYDVLAEPREVSREELRQAYTRLIEAVRVVNPRALIFVSGLEWGREINSWLTSPLPYEDIVYRSNPYNKPGEFAGLFGEIAQKYPVFLGEFGANGYPPMSEESVQALLEYADQLGLGWTAWNFSAEGGCPCLLTDEQRFLPSSYGKIVKAALSQTSQSRSQTSPDLEVKPDFSGTYQVYSDFLHHGFIDYSWGGQVDLLASQPVFSGNKSIKVTFTSEQAGFFLTSSIPVPGEDFSTLAFWVTMPEAELGRLEIYLKNGQDQLSPRLNLSPYRAQERGDWQQIVVPLADFQMNQSQITGFFLGKAGQQPISAFNLDEIKFQN